MDKQTGQGLQSGTDRRRPWWSRELRKTWRCRELRRPWRCRELQRPWRCRELWRPWQVVFVAVASSHSARPLQPELYYPPKKNPWGSLGGIRSPPGLSSGTGVLLGLSLEAEVLTGHDGSTTALLGLDVESGALTGYAQQPLPLLRQERQVAGNGLHGHNQRSLPQTSLHGPDRKDKIH